MGQNPGQWACGAGEQRDAERASFGAQKVCDLSVSQMRQGTEGGKALVLLDNVLSASLRP